MIRRSPTRQPGPRRLAAWTLMALLAAPGALGQGVAVEGSDSARFRAAATESFPPYANAGYRLSHGDDGVLVVEVSLEPLASAAPFPAAAARDGEAGKGPAPSTGSELGKAEKSAAATVGKSASASPVQPPKGAPRSQAAPAPPAGSRGAAVDGPTTGDGEVARLARRLTGEARTQHAAVSAVLGWMARTVADSTAAGGNAGIAPVPSTGKPGGDAADPAPADSPAGSATRPGASQRGTSQHGAGQPPGNAQTGTPKAGAARPEDAKPAAQAAADPQAPEAVLARASGDPVGVARLAVALLAAAGIEARVVRGVVAGVPEPGGAHGRHAWIEVRYPDRGWVFSDPLRHHHYVPATYLRAAPELSGAKSAAPRPGTAQPDPSGPAPTVPPPTRSAESGGAPGGPGSPAGAGEARLLERRDLRKTVDLYPPGAPGVTARRNRPEQLAAALRVVVAGGGRALAVLEGPEGRSSKVLPGGEGVFVGLAGGSYRLEVFPDGAPPVVRQVEVQARERGAVFVRQDSAARPVPRAGVPTRGGRRTASAS
ncbi:MAG TPA: transglutaminase domain-containing protein [Thermoanaerobaculia bacterium]|nr:transglutaminase domain-containing protein [Thermoanaerobaculia bacterium]